MHQYQSTPLNDSSRYGNNNSNYGKIPKDWWIRRALAIATDVLLTSFDEYRRSANVCAVSITTASYKDSSSGKNNRIDLLLELSSWPFVLYKRRLCACRTA